MGSLRDLIAPVPSEAIGFSALKLDPKPGGVNRLAGVQWWPPKTEETVTMQQFSIQPAKDGGYTVCCGGGNGSPSYNVPSAFAGALGDCLEYVRATFAKADEVKAAGLADKAAQETTVTQAQAIRDDREKEIAALYANAGLPYHGNDY